MGSEASSDSEKEVAFSGFDISALPEELFVYVLMFVPPKDVVRQCSLVCKHWLAVSRSQSLWRRKCEQERKYVPGIMGPPPEDFMVFYFKNPYTRNLLRNTHAGAYGLVIDVVVAFFSLTRIFGRMFNHSFPACTFFFFLVAFFFKSRD